MEMNFSNYEINSQKRYAEEIKKFLNFILINSEEPIFTDLMYTGLKGLSLIHGAYYLNHISKKVTNGEIKVNTFKFTETILVRFYYWLNELELLEENIIIKVERKNINRRKERQQLVSPFGRLDLEVLYPRGKNAKKTVLHDFGSGRIDLVELFLNVAEIIEPDISLGVALQCLGGIRIGEVVNLKENSVREVQLSKYKPIIVDVRDNWRELFPDANNLIFEQVKNEREQIILRVEIVNRLLKTHSSRRTRKNNLNSQAMFIDSVSGKPIRGQAYRKRFNNIKKHFLEILLDRNIEDYNYLTSKPWSSHIGRGIYTNILVFNLKWTPSEVKLARGDASIESANAYIEESNLIELTNAAIKELDNLFKEGQNGRLL